MVNKVIMVGRVARPPHYNAGDDETIFPIRTKGVCQSGVSEEQQESQYHRIIARGEIANRCKVLREGEAIYIEGELQASFVKFLSTDTKSIGSLTSEIILNVMCRIQDL